MIKRKPLPFVIDDEQQGLMELASWAWNSHYWIEESEGYLKCKYCGKDFTSTMGVRSDFPLCKENPILMGYTQKDKT